MSRLPVQVLVRFLVAVAVVAAFSGVMRLIPDDGGGANIGAGLLLFAALWAICFAWSLDDARRQGFVRSLATWALVGLLIGIAFPFSIALGDGDWDGEVVRSDLATFIPFWLFSMTSVAAVGSAIGDRLRPRP